MSDSNASYDLAVDFVCSKIEGAAYGGRQFASVSDMRDCDCIPLTVHDSAGIRWDLVSAVVGDRRRLLAIYERLA